MRSELLTQRLSLASSGLVIDGDSMLYRLLPVSQETGSVGLPQYGHCALHVVHRVQRYLSSYTDHRVPVFVVFFKSHEAFFRETSYRALRAIVAASLQSLPEQNG